MAYMVKSRKPGSTSLLLLLSAAQLLHAASFQSVMPPGTKLAGPYSPGIVAGDYLYVSGQGAKQPDGSYPADTAAQLRQCLENIRSVVQAAGFSMDGLVYSQVYVSDARAFPEVERAWAANFPRNGPARSMLGVANLPEKTPVEVNAVVLRDPLKKKAIFAGGEHGAVPDVVLTPERAYISDCRASLPAGSAAEVHQALERMGVVLKVAGLDYGHMVFVNPFLTEAVASEPMNQEYAKFFEFGNTPARGTIRVASLPDHSHIEFTGVAIRDLSQRRAVRPKNMPPSATASPCVLAGDTFYCSAKSGFIPGPMSGIYASTVEEQSRQTWRNLLDGLEEAGLGLENVVAANVYLNDIAEFHKMNGVYKQYFGAAPPARTTVQQSAPLERKMNEHEQWPTLEQISIVAVQGPRPFELQAKVPAFWNLIAPEAVAQTVASGLGFTEGPVWDPRGFLYVSDEVTNKILKLYPDGRHEDVVSLGDPDGNTYDAEHRLIDCASVLRAIIAVQPNGQYTVVADRFEGKKFNSPNDVVMGPDKALYFTDPTLDLVKGEKQELPYQGVYRLGPDGSVRLLIRDLAQPNGLAFSPDGRKLYVDDSQRKDIHVYDVRKNGGVAHGRLFAKLDGPGDPDGMRLDVAGNLFVTGPGGVWVFDPSGRHLGTIVLPEATANLAWGDADLQTLYITSSTSVLKLRTKTKGFVPYLQ